MPAHLLVDLQGLLMPSPSDIGYAKSAHAAACAWLITYFLQQ